MALSETDERILNWYWRVTGHDHCCLPGRKKAPPLGRGRRFEPVPGSHFIFLRLRHPSSVIEGDHKTESHRVDRAVPGTTLSFSADDPWATLLMAHSS